MLTAKILNPAATLNSFKELGSLEFVPNTALKIIMQLFDTAENLRMVPTSDAVLVVTLNNSDSTDFDVTATLNASDRSLATVELTAIQTAALIGGNIQLELTQGTDPDPVTVTKGIVFNALQKINLCDC